VLHLKDESVDSLCARIHLDEVERLGTFIELEAVAPQDSDLYREHGLVTELHDALGITDERLVALGYAAQLSSRQPSRYSRPAAPACCTARRDRTPTTRSHRDQIVRSSEFPSAAIPALARAAYRYDIRDACHQGAGRP
jgi:hypothetical protein